MPMKYYILYKFILFCTVQCTLLIVLLYLPLLSTYWEINGFWLRTRKRLNGFCLILQICNFNRMFVDSNKFSHLFPIHLVFLILALCISQFRELAFFENELANAPPPGKKLFKCPGVGAQKCFIFFVSRLSFNKI